MQDLAVVNDIFVLKTFCFPPNVYILQTLCLCVLNRCQTHVRMCVTRAAKFVACWLLLWGWHASSESDVSSVVKVRGNAVPGTLKIAGERSWAPHRQIFRGNATWHPYDYSLLATTASVRASLWHCSNHEAEAAQPDLGTVAFLLVNKTTDPPT